MYQVTFREQYGRNRSNPFTIHSRTNGKQARLPNSIKELLVGLYQIGPVSSPKAVDIILVATVGKLGIHSVVSVESAIRRVIPRHFISRAHGIVGLEAGIYFTILPDEVVKDRASSGRLSPGADLLLVAPDLLDILVHPLEQQCLVVQASVGKPGLLHVVAGKKAKGAGAVVARDKNGIVVGGPDDGPSRVQDLTVILAAEGISAAVYPNNNR